MFSVYLIAYRYNTFLMAKHEYVTCQKYSATVIGHFFMFRYCNYCFSCHRFASSRSKLPKQQTTKSKLVMAGSGCFTGRASHKLRHCRCSLRQCMSVKGQGLELKRLKETRQSSSEEARLTWWDE